MRVYSGEVYRKTWWVMRVSDAPCKLGECDEDRMCWRHDRMAETAARWRRLKS